MEAGSIVVAAAIVVMVAAKAAAVRSSISSNAISSGCDAAALQVLLTIFATLSCIPQLLPFAFLGVHFSSH